MPLPTLQGATVNSIANALAIFYAVHLGILPKANRRLDVDERESLTSGDVYVWEERDVQADVIEGIERWTDGIKWGSSRVRNDFLFYYERDHDPKEPQAVQDARLIKQTYSVFFQAPDDPRKRSRKLHMVAYYTQATVEGLCKIEQIPHLASLEIPDGMYRPARVKRGQTRGSEASSPPRLSFSRHHSGVVDTQSQTFGASGSSAPTYAHSDFSGDTGYISRYVPYRRDGIRSVTPPPTPHTTLLRRASTPSGDGRSEHNSYLLQATQPLAPQFPEGGAPSRSMQKTATPYSPDSPNLFAGPNAPFRILPLPKLSGSRRIAADDKALGALQKQFMK